VDAWRPRGGKTTKGKKKQPGKTWLKPCRAGHKRQEEIKAVQGPGRGVKKRKTLEGQGIVTHYKKKHADTACQKRRHYQKVAAKKKRFKKGKVQRATRCHNWGGQRGPDGTKNSRQESKAINPKKGAAPADYKEGPGQGGWVCKSLTKKMKCTLPVLKQRKKCC